MDRGAWQATVHGVAESDTTERLHSLKLSELMSSKAGLDQYYYLNKHHCYIDSH